MTSAGRQVSEQGSKRPRREQAWIDDIAALLALAAGPAAWSIQLVVGYGLSSHACFPRDRPLPLLPPQGGWSGETAVLLAINLACLLLAAGGAVVSHRYWKGARAEGDAGRKSGRCSFLGACGLIAGLGFGLAILFDTPVILATPACWRLPT
ncbi:MAG: hypothetical protein JO303_07030 [Caulobacteraceae bacterium]|nr:hypothetical protein [Caulobacteraceae bacterium]